MIGVYAICYKEADWLGFNIRRMYGWVDEFAIVVGPVEALKAPADDETVDALCAIPDPDGKITVVGGIWKNKNEMCDKAISMLKSDIILQLDSDEIWPEEAFTEAVRLMRKGRRKLKAHMYTFWKNPETVLTCWDAGAWLAGMIDIPRGFIDRVLVGEPGASDALKRAIHERPRAGHRRGQINGKVLPLLAREVQAGNWKAAHSFMLTLHGPVRDPREADVIIMLTLSGVARKLLSEPSTPWLLDMHRVYRPGRFTKIGHIPPDLTWPNGESAYWSDGATLLTPLWHFSYVGLEHVARKFTFFNARDGAGAMPKIEEWQDWREKHMNKRVMMTGQSRGFAKYEGPPIPQDILDFVKGAA